MDERALAERLRTAPVPDELGARERARRVVQAAAAEAGPAPRRSQRTGERLAAAVALALVVTALVAATPPGDAVARWVRDLVTRPSGPQPRTVRTPLPATGRLLVTGPGGVWVVRGDGSRRRLGAYGDAAWSPRGLFAAVTRGRDLLVVEPSGAVRWALGRVAAVHDPRWQPTTGYRIAYRTAGAMRVVAGDGSGDHALVPAVAPVPAAWRAGRRNVLALARRDGAVEAWDADARRRLWRARPGGRPLALAWAGRRLMVATPGGLTLLGAHGAVRGRRPVAGVRAAALAPGGRTVALVRGGALLLVGLDGGAQRVLYAAPQRLATPTWSPDGRRLLVAVPAADQWVVLPVRGSARLLAVAGVARRFDPRPDRPRGVPRVAGWTDG